MSLTIESGPGAEARLLDEAARRGLPPVELSRKLIEDALPAALPPDALDPEELEQRLDALAAQDRLSPVLAAEGTSRAAIYADHDQPCGFSIPASSSGMFSSPIP